ncbi:MAG: HAD family hydrolase [bacterium]|nr:HAD family hydrolase [bacterium]MDD5353612.1 HAD family hydrolase [bacterium]MDD5757197.1 HAD family hydrolase [bacterium]
MIKLVIFDLDGTLINAYRAIEKSLNFTLRSLGYKKISYDRCKRAVGRGDKHFISQFVKAADASKGLTLYRKHHREALQRYSTLKPQARKVLSALQRQGIKLAVASNRPTKFSNVLVRHLDLEKYFDLIVCADKKHELKPEPYLLKKALKKLKIKPQEALYVGDMVYDIKAGKNAKVKAIAILGGSCSRKELAQQKPYKVINNLRQLLKIM